MTLLIKDYAAIAAEEKDFATDYPACQLWLGFDQDTTPSSGTYDAVSGQVCTIVSGSVDYTSSSDGAVGGTTAGSHGSIIYDLPSDITVSNTEFGLFVISTTLPASGVLTAFMQLNTIANGKLGVNGVDGAAKFQIDDAASTQLSSTRSPTSTLNGSRELFGIGYVAAIAAGTNQLRLVDAVSSAGTTTITTESCARSITALTFTRIGLTLECSGEANSLHSISFWKFASVPSDLLAAMAWMRNYHSPYPGWKART